MSLHASQMEFDFAAPVVPRAARAVPDGAHLAPAEERRRRTRGEVSYHAGLAAEDQVARDFEHRGYPLLRRRWRGRSGEIDLIFGDGEGFVFVEVKASWSFDQALEHLRWPQIRRLQRAAEEFAGTQPRGALSDMRFDVALLNRHGMLRVIENAIGP
ncbi:YraN family protein [Alloyangia pacifica]|uniref:YraN family protein n=1 Tax=Alloyangia pacifica TaxID=311180 RepID=UPI001CD7FAE3|nr:YraN family protein [Alloyangia pacifica]MCA0997906.1 YraN family protein [Alloyangia pacifica]